MVDRLFDHMLPGAKPGVYTLRTIRQLDADCKPQVTYFPYSESDSENAVTSCIGFDDIDLSADDLAHIVRYGRLTKYSF